MGAYLSEPLTEKTSTDETSEKLSFGASSMQGWRVSQEDAHNSILDFDTNSSLFAVYDGHGGAEVAKYCEMKMPQFIKDTQAYKDGKFSEALEEAFLNIDATISTPEIIELLKSLSDNPESTADPDEAMDDKEEVSDLWEEASMPLDKIMARYREGQANPLLAKLKDGPEKPVSPFLRSKRAGSSSAGDSSGAGCSSKQSYNDECEVSSSIKDGEAEGKSTESQVSTTNGESASENNKDTIDEIKEVKEENTKATPQISGSGDSVAPDTSDDSKATQSQQDTNQRKLNGEVTDSKESATSSSQSENGEVKSPSKKGKAIIKSSNATSSESNTPEQSSQPKRSRRATANLYNSILGLIQAQQGDEDDDESDSNDETFEGKEETSSSEEGEEEEGGEVNGVEGEEGESSEDIEEEEDSTDEDDEMDAFNMAIKNEPGSNSGCTAVVALLKGNQLFVANAGDSRCVVCRDGKALDMSIDHKPEDEIEFERILKAGGKVSSDGRVNGGLNLSRAIGDLGYKLNTELGPKEQMITALPDIKTITLDPATDDFMVLACDGIWNSMTSQDVVDFVKTRLEDGVGKLSTICEEMFDHCLSPNTSGDGTGCDNMTAVIVKFKSGNVSKKRTKDDQEEDEETSQAKRSKTEDTSSSVTSSE